MGKGFISTIVLIIFFNLFFIPSNFADTVYLKDGHKEEGEIIEETDDYIIVFDPKSLWRIVIYKRYIDKIERNKTSEPEKSEKFEKEKLVTEDITKDTTKE